MNDTGVDDYMDAQDKCIAELEAENKRSTLQAMKEIQQKHKRITELEAENERLQALAEKAWKQADDANNAALKSALRNAELEVENERLLIELDDISKQAAKELTGEAIQARVKITMESIHAARKGK